MTLVHILPGPSWERSTAPDDRATRWCFQCRKHLPHTWALMDDPPERQPSYYMPLPVLRCSRCHRDHTVHPGSYRDGPAVPSDAVWEQLVATDRTTPRPEPNGEGHQKAAVEPRTKEQR